MIGQFQMTTSTKTVKAVNYTPEQTALATSQYIAGVSVEQIAMALGKSARSIVAKLSRELKGTENEYKAKTYASKTGEAVVKKDELADKMSSVFGLTEAEADSLTKANKTALKKILDKVSGLQKELDETFE
jgi:hypothetical protein